MTLTIIQFWLLVALAATGIVAAFSGAAVLLWFAFVVRRYKRGVNHRIDEVFQEYTV